mmetsp:Transcript_115517/g.337938  ORF Transcript_115517/g.337938 Transcript_115517/m.337938 type:complete len:281 (-) Transcript_115517:1065-1907(-)
MHVLQRGVRDRCLDLAEAHVWWEEGDACLRLRKVLRQVLHAVAHRASEECGQQVVLREQARAPLQVPAAGAAEGLQDPLAAAEECGDVGVDLRDEELRDAKAGAEVVLGDLRREGPVREGPAQHVEGLEPTCRRVLHDQAARIHNAHGSAGGSHRRRDGHRGRRHVVQHHAGGQLLREVRGEHDGDRPARACVGLLERPGAEVGLSGALEVLRGHEGPQTQEVQGLPPPGREPAVRRVPQDDVGHEHVLHDLLVRVDGEEGGDDGSARDAADDLWHEALL